MLPPNRKGYVRAGLALSMFAGVALADVAEGTLFGIAGVVSASVLFPLVSTAIVCYGKGKSGASGLLVAALVGGVAVICLSIRCYVTTSTVLLAPASSMALGIYMASAFLPGGIVIHRRGERSHGRPRSRC